MDFLKKIGKKAKNEMVITAPMKGEYISLQEVNDPVFSEGIMGMGIAVKPMDGKVFAPTDGLITTIFPTGHAIGIKTEEGVELLIHVGMDTVALKGEHFSKHVEDGQQVKRGDLLIEADLEKIREAGYDTVTPMVVCNTSDYTSVEGILGLAENEEFQAIKIIK